MDRETAYVSSIPEEAREKITQKHGNGARKRAEYFLGKELVGFREFYRDNTPEGEYSFRNGVPHGWEYRWSTPGELTSAESRENGVVHGTAYQWGRDGRLIGSYTIDHGTGIDLWREELEDGRVNLSEAYQYVDGRRHGFEWHFMNGDLSDEKHWMQGILHGIERSWNSKGGLSRGYPRYWINDERVTKAKYVRAALKDDQLPPFRLEDNQCLREFPAEVAQHIRV